MKELAVGLCLAVLCFIAACTTNNTRTSEMNRGNESSESAQKDGREIAEHIRDLLVTKCGEEYYLTNPFNDSISNKFDSTSIKNVPIQYLPLPVAAKDKFYGIQARGNAIIFGVVFELVKKGGEWYTRTDGKDGDIKIDKLKPPQPECPGSNASGNPTAPGRGM